MGIRLRRAERLSKIGCAEFVAVFPAPNIQPGSNGTYSIAVGVERVQEAGFVRVDVRLNSRQRSFIDKKGSFDRAVISPESHRMPHRVVGAAGVGKLDHGRHSPRYEGDAAGFAFRSVVV